jgi:hypothetical protein
MKISSWSVGVTVAQRGEDTLARTLESLKSAGFPQPRIFADGDLSIPVGYESTQRTPRIGGWPNFWLAVTELAARDPNADLYLIVQDDVVFSREVRTYVEQWDLPEDCGVLSLFCPTCNNGTFGFHTMPGGYGMASAQALAFPRERVFEFLAHPWTVNHRRAAPKSQHFRGDGLHHIDGAVGEWCHRANLKVYTHSPSLSQHIGHVSIMYPKLKGKLERRFSDSFPGEQIDATHVYPEFAAVADQWRQSGADLKWALPGQVWASISQFLKPGMKTFEAGCGLSTKLFVNADCQHTSLENDPKWIAHLIGTFPDCRNVVVPSQLVGNPLWYDWIPPSQPYDLILLDGPAGNYGRMGVLHQIEKLIHDDTIIVMDDSKRHPESHVTKAIAELLDWGIRESTAGHHGYSLIARSFRTSS